jgi:uncharacterized membrane protein
VIFALVLWDTPNTRLAAACLAFVGLVFSVYLIVLQVFVLDAVCIWCLANDVLIAPALAVLTAVRLRTWGLAGEPSARRGRGSPRGCRPCT